MTVEAELKKTFAENKEKEMILFVCAGNTCRSPMAEALFNHMYSGKATSRYAESSGLFGNWQPLSSNAECALRNAGIKNFIHYSRSIDLPTVKRASKIIALTSGIAENLILDYPEYAGKISAFPKDISDPFGGALPVYAECLEEIRAGLIEMFGNPAEAENECN